MLDRNKRKILMWSSVSLFVLNGGLNGYFANTASSGHDADGGASDIPSISLIAEKPQSGQSSSKRLAKNTHEVDPGHSPSPESNKHRTATEMSGKHKNDAGTDGIKQDPLTHEPDASMAPGNQMQEKAIVPSDSSSAQVMMVCYKSGPFTSRSAARKMNKAVAKLGVKASIKKKLKREKLGFWVYLKPERSLALSRLKAEEIKTKGIKDVAVVIKSKPKYAISLGVFKIKQTAEARKIKAESLGFKPLLTTRYNSKTQRWVEIQMAADQEPSEEQWRSLLKGKKGIEIKPMECKP